MIADILEDGTLVIHAGSSIEAFALSEWFAKYMNKAADGSCSVCLSIDTEYYKKQPGVQSEFIKGRWANVWDICDEYEKDKD